MGFIKSADTVTITAKLTPFGRQQLLTNTSNIITQFGLGDSDANYLGTSILGRGMIPSLSGEIGSDNLFSNGVASGVGLKSPIIVNSTGATKKPVVSGSNSVIITPKLLGLKELTGTTLNQIIIDRRNGDIDGYTNLFHTFGLPITQTDKDKYTTFNLPQGYLNTAINGFNKNKALVISIDECEYGEIIDGKAVKIELETSGGTQYTLYSTFQKSLTPLTSLDSQNKEVLELGSAIGNNVAFLFSDQIQRPNENPNKSWGTGFNSVKPFSVKNKELFNATSVPSTNTNMDIAVGIVYLDRGMIVITHPDIVNEYNTNTASGTTKVTFNSISNEVAQNINCVVERTEFTTTNNRTFTSGESIRVSEVALYDNFNNVIALAKSNEHIVIGSNQYMVIGVRILV